MKLTTAALVRDFPVDCPHLCGLTVDREFVWFSDEERQQILALDPVSGRVVRQLPCPGVRTGLTILDGALLQVVGLGRDLRKVDVRSGEQIAVFANPRPGGELCGIEACAAGVWMGYKNPSVLELRRPPDFELIESIAIDREIAGVTVAGRFVAIASHAAAQVHLLNTDTGRIVSLDVRGNPTGIGWDGSRIWYCDYTNRRIRAIDLSEPPAEE